VLLGQLGVYCKWCNLDFEMMNYKHLFMLVSGRSCAAYGLDSVGGR
jgi:hypothetical protein